MAAVGSDVTELKLHSCIGFTGESDTQFQQVGVTLYLSIYLVRPQFCSLRSVPYLLRVSVEENMVVWLSILMFFPVTLLLLLVYG